MATAESFAAAVASNNAAAQKAHDTFTQLVNDVRAYIANQKRGGGGSTFPNLDSLEQSVNQSTSMMGDIASGASSEDTDVNQAGQPAALTLTPSSARVAIGAQQLFTVSDPKAVLTVSDPTIGTIDQTGEFTGVTAGTATITATTSTGSATATATVS